MCKVFGKLLFEKHTKYNNLEKLDIYFLTITIQADRKITIIIKFLTTGAFWELRNCVCIVEAILGFRGQKKNGLFLVKSRWQGL